MANFSNLIGGLDTFCKPIDKFLLTEQQMHLLQQKEMCVHGIPVEILARVNLFVNGL